MDEAVRVLSDVLGTSPEETLEYLKMLANMGAGSLLPFIPRACSWVKLLCFLTGSALLSLVTTKPTELVQAVVKELNGDAEYEQQSRLLLTANLIVHEVDLLKNTIGKTHCNGVVLPPLSKREHRMIASVALKRARKIKEEQNKRLDEARKIREEAEKVAFMKAIRAA